MALRMEVWALGSSIQKDDRNAKENYRPITLLPCVGKVLEKLVGTQINTALGSRFYQNSSANRKAHCLETTLINVVEDWRLARDARQVMRILSTDMSKAFDSLHPSLLLCKLKVYGLQESAIQLLGSYLNERKYQVKISRHVSSSRFVSRGCPRGSALGPLLWNVFQNDPSYCLTVNLSMYVDDRQIYHAGADQAAVISLLKDSANLATTCGSTLSRHVTGLEKYTEYKFQVLAYTSEGDGPKGSVEVERTMEDAPSRPPSNFYVTATSSTTVTASWQLPSVDSRNGIIKGFKVFYKRKDSSGSGIILTINGGSTFKKNVTGLNKYTEYEFQVLAFTSVGDGPYSSMVVERTNEDVPSQPPGNFTSTASTSTSITASWQLPPADSRNGVITGYKLFYKKRGISRPARMQPINNQATHTQEVTELNKFTEYEFQILAFTSVGDGPKSTTIFEKTKEAAPSGPPSQFNVTVNSSTSIIASWHLPPEESRHGIIIGYKLFYKEKDSGFGTFLTINNGKTSKRVINLDEYTEYEFQVLAFTSAGNGPNTSSVFTKTMEDAPSAPTSLAVVDVPPSNLHGPRITLSWSKPTELNGVIRGYNLFYSHGGGAPKGIPVMDKDTLRHTVDVLGGMTYRFHVRAVTVKPGVNGTITVTTKEYEPSVGPDSLFSSQLNKTTFNISWEPLQNEMSYGRVILYEVRADVWWTAHFHNWFAPNNLTANTSETFVVLFDLMVCYKYNISVRAYTGAGPGPYSEPLELVTSSQTPGEFRATSYGTTHVTLTWKHSNSKELVTYTVNYNGTKFYDKSFKHVGAQKTNSTTYAVRGLFPGTSYKFEIYGSSDCGKTANKSVYITTHIMAPNSPLPLNMTDVEVSGTAVDIYLWPVEQENGPISAYQVIVLKVVDGVEELPGDYGSQLKAASDAKKDYFDFYIAAEIENVPVIEKPWKFTVGDSEKTANYKNEILESGENYIVYERALTKTKDVILEGKASKVAKITISPDTQSILLASVIALSFTVFVLLVKICGLIWQQSRSRAVPNKWIQNKEEIDFNGVKSSPDQQSSKEEASDPNTYMELKPRPSNQKYKLFYKKKDLGFGTSLTIDNGKTSKRVINLDEYTEYEFQVLAFTSAGSGPNSSSVFTKTMEDAPSTPTSLSSVDVPPSKLHGPRITLSWSKPTEPNGVIRGYDLFYSHSGGAPKGIPLMDRDTLRHTVDVLGGMTYRFHVRAVTIKPGANGTLIISTKEYGKLCFHIFKMTFHD
ncbi:Receptor-type tyrosine-protein phosphatase F [Stylophora pistillata]|uniref:Receptor-type tyrosine-protein phosphatase F n=1 Tax=Stylophora pistillata TaxID=50429 RepID=A0A2B4RBL7_STYPI|nr:Receptor-type tyrosine-protein phosphatase F [Stylophora pistillata]